MTNRVPAIDPQQLADATSAAVARLQSTTDKQLAVALLVCECEVENPLVQAVSNNPEALPVMIRILSNCHMVDGGVMQGRKAN